MRSKRRFTRAVEIRLRADVPVVGYLSGGVDSAYVLATAARVSQAMRCRASPCAFPTLRSTRWTARWRPQRAIGGGRSTVVEAGPDLITDSYAALITAAESPVLDTSCAALLALSREVRAQGYKVVLTGEGADEAFAGYVWFKIRELARTLDMGDAFRPSTAISRAARKWATPNLGFGDVRPHRRHDRWPARAVDPLQSRRHVARPLLQRGAEGRARRPRRL